MKMFTGKYSTECLLIAYCVKDDLELIKKELGDRKLTEKMNEEVLINLAKGNSVLYAFVSNLKNKNIFEFSPVSTSIITKIFAKEHQLFQSTVKLTSALIDIFTQYDLPILTIKSFLSYPFADEDIDIVAVNGNQIEKYNEILSEHGFVELKDRSHLREPKKRFFQFHNKDIYPLIHLHSAISWNGIDYSDPKLVWSRRKIIQVQGHLIPIPSPEDEIIIMAAHSVFENKYISLGDLLHLSNLVGGNRIDWYYIFNLSKRYNWCCGLSLFLETADNLYQQLYGTRLVPAWILEKLVSEFRIAKFIKIRIGNMRRFPFMYLYSTTLIVSMHKLLLDIYKKQFSQIPRQLFSYIIVDFLMYRRNFKKQRIINKKW